MPQKEFDLFQVAASFSAEPSKPSGPIQLREGRWVLADLCGKGRRIRTVAVPMWVKQGIIAWMTAAGIDDGRLLRRVTKAGEPKGDGLSDWAVWSVVEQAAKEIGIERFGAHDLRRTCAVAFWRDHGCRSHGLRASDQSVGVVAAVGKDGFGLLAF